LTNKPDGNQKICERCCQPTDILYTVSTDNDDDHEEVMKICWDCEWDITNGQGELSDDSGVILANRRQNDYEYDTINVERPY